MKISLLLSCLLTLLLPSCSMVTVKQPAGDGAAEMDPDLWTAKWRGAEGVRCSTRILDAKKGIVQFRAMPPGEKEEVFEIVVREMSGRTVVTWMDKNSKSAGEYAFLRAAISPDHLALFMPNQKQLSEAVEKGLIRGTIRRPENKENQIVVGSQTILERFGTAEAEKLGGVLACFEPDPTQVLIRDDKPAARAVKPKGEKPGK